RKITMFPASDPVALEFSFFIDNGVGLSNNFIILSFCAEEFRFATHDHLAIFHGSVWGLQEAHLIDLGVYPKCGDQSDIGSLRCFDGTKSTVMRVMYIPHLESGAFPGESSWSER